MPRRRRSADEVHALIAEYRSSGETQKQFSARTGVPLSTLGVWLRKDRESSSTALVAIAPTSGSDAPLVLHVGDARLEIPRDVTPDELLRIRTAWLD
jgi:transposase-like protein